MAQEAWFSARKHGFDSRWWYNREMAQKSLEKRIARRLQRRYRGHHWTQWGTEMTTSKLARVVYLHGEEWAKAYMFNAWRWHERYPQDPHLERYAKRKRRGDRWSHRERI